MKSSAVFLGLLIILKAGAAEAGPAGDCALTGNTDGAIQGCTLIIERIGVDSADGAKAFLNRGNAYQNRGALSRAIADYDEAIRLNPRFALAFNNRGVANKLDGNLSRAVADFDEALRLEPQFALAFYNRGLAHLAMGHVARAIADYDKAVQLAPDYRDGFYQQRCDRGPALRQYADADFNTQ